MATSSFARPRTPPLPSDALERLDQADHLMTANELARLLAISPKTLYGYASRKVIPHYKIEANVRFRGRDIAEWLRRCSA